MSLLYILGRHLHEYHLTYTPGEGPHACCSSRHRIFILETFLGRGGLQVHRSDTGEHEGTVTRQQLEVVDDREIINAIWCGEGDELILLLYNRNTRKRRLVEYQVK